MIPSAVLNDALQDLLAADTATLAPAVNANKVHLSMTTFLPGQERVVGDFTEATFTGATALLAGTGTQQTFLNPLNGERIIQLKEPAGGWHWQASDAVNLPQTIYGYWVTDNTSADLLGCELLPEPITLNNAGDAVDLPNIRMQFKASSIT